MYPCAFMLMNGKKKVDYVRVINIIKEAADSYGYKLNPKMIMTDFEKSAINAFEFCFPNIETKGCYFHYAQALYRKCCELGMKTMYHNDEEVRTWVKKMMALPLVHFGNLSIRTNNNLEGFHLKLNKLVKTAKPNIYKLIGLIKKEESSARALYTRVNAGLIKAKPKAQTLFKEERLKNLKLKLELQPGYDLDEYLEDCAMFAATFTQKRKIAIEVEDEINEDLSSLFT